MECKAEEQSLPEITHIRLLIADDHPVVRKGMASLLATEPGFEVVGEAANGAEAVAAAASLHPDVVLMDMIMPVMDGMEAIETIISADPSVRILVLTSSYDDRFVIPSIKAGALGYLLKESSADDLIHAIREVSQGRPFLQQALASRIVNQLAQVEGDDAEVDPLTERETDVLRHVADGESNQAIAEALHLSERTVGTHVTNILNKLNLTNRTQAALYALRRGIAKLETS
jgi:NarL family two-component system response regulator LiaR